MKNLRLGLVEEELPWADPASGLELLCSPAESVVNESIFQVPKGGRE